MIDVIHARKHHAIKARLKKEIDRPKRGVGDDLVGIKELAIRTPFDRLRDAIERERGQRVVMVEEPDPGRPSDRKSPICGRSYAPIDGGTNEREFASQGLPIEPTKGFGSRRTVIGEYDFANARTLSANGIDKLIQIARIGVCLLYTSDAADE